MQYFYEALTYVNENFYEPNHLIIEEIEEESQNEKYGAGCFRIGSRTARFRVAKQTPKKTGQFVVFWKKDSENKNQAYSYEQAADFLIVNTFGSEGRFGQFIFPKAVLAKQGILKTETSDGKMAIRVYPDWDAPANKQAIAAQSWQLPYFINLSHPDSSLQLRQYFERNR